MEIIIEEHTLLRAKERGAAESEIIDVVNNGDACPAKGQRNCRSKVFKFDAYRNGKHFNQKKIEVIFVQEKEKIITVTVYVFYGQWH